MITKNRLKRILTRFSSKKIVVIGDMMVDEYIYGLTSRISREAPVLILKFDSETIAPGGGGNAANNVHSLGGIVYPVGVIGDDLAGRKLLEIFKGKGIETSGIIVEKGRPTTTKTRIMAGGIHTTKQQIIRIDREVKVNIDTTTEKKILQFIKGLFNEVDGIIISDYGYGLLTPQIRKELISRAKAKGKVITADSRYDLLKYKKVTITTPNEPEAGEALGMDIIDEISLVRAGQKLLRKLNTQAVLITRGSKGMSLFEDNGEITQIPVFGGDQIADVTGAGDTVASAVTLALASGATMKEAALLSNYAGGIKVTKRGTATVSKEELEAVLERG